MLLENDTAAQPISGFRLNFYTYAFSTYLSSFDNRLKLLLCFILLDSGTEEGLPKRFWLLWEGVLVMAYSLIVRAAIQHGITARDGDRLSN